MTINEDISNEPLEDGDVFDADTESHLGGLHVNDEGLPANVMMLYKGYWYYFKMDYKVKQEEDKPLDTGKG